MVEAEVGVVRCGVIRFRPGRERRRRNSLPVNDRGPGGIILTILNPFIGVQNMHLPIVKNHYEKTKWNC